MNIGCGKMYATQSSRAVHARKCTKPKGSPKKIAKKVGEQYSCRYCYKTFALQCSVYRHKPSCNAWRLLEGKEPIEKPQRKTFQCTQCQKIFDRKGKLEKHMNCHLEQKLHYCKTCGKRFKQLKYFNEYTNMCTPVDLEIFQPSFVLNESLLTSNVTSDDPPHVGKCYALDD